MSSEPQRTVMKLLPVTPYIRTASITQGPVQPGVADNRVVPAGGKIWVKIHELPTDPKWTHYIVYEYQGPFVNHSLPNPVLGLVPIDRSEPHATVHIDREVRFSSIRAALVHYRERPPPGGPSGPTEGNSTTLGNGNGCTTVVVP